MLRKFFAVAAFWAVAAGCSTASAGVFADDLSRCLVKSTSDTDRVVLMRWIFSAMALNPNIAPLSSITSAQHDDFNKSGAELFQRLLEADCRKESVAALHNEGGGVLEASFGVLGQAAVRDLMGDPKVAEGLAKFGQFFDKDKIAALLKEAGVAAPPAASAPAK